jgi:hypothetical protein
MKISVFLSILFFLPAIGSASIFYVPDDYNTIQGAIDISVSGDTIIVRPGTYIENIIFSGETITLRSEYGPDVTTIDGNQAGSVVEFDNCEPFVPELEGFSLTNGTGRHFGNSYVGGGIFCNESSPSIRLNKIYDNRVPAADYGGGIYCYSNSKPIIYGNVIVGNDGGNSGGGIRCENYCDATISNNVIAGNRAIVGAGIFSALSKPIISNNTIFSNKASQEGGGLYCFHTSYPEIFNTIMWDNDAPLGSEICIAYKSWGSSTLTISSSDIQGGQSSIYVDPKCNLNWGTGMIDDDPRLVDSANGDFHLTWNSPCRDTGDNSSVTETEDFEGDPRIALSTVDMGADEYYYHLYHTGDVIPGSSIDVKIVGYPGAIVALALNDTTVDPQ